MSSLSARQFNSCLPHREEKRREKIFTMLTFKQSGWAKPVTVADVFWDGHFYRIPTDLECQGEFRKIEELGQEESGNNDVCVTTVIMLFQAGSVMRYFGLFLLDFILFCWLKIGNAYLYNALVNQMMEGNRCGGQSISWLKIAYDVVVASGMVGGISWHSWRKPWNFREYSRTLLKLCGKPAGGIFVSWRRAMSYNADDKEELSIDRHWYVLQQWRHRYFERVYHMGTKNMHFMAIFPIMVKYMVNNQPMVKVWTPGSGNTTSYLCSTEKYHHPNHPH